MCIMEIHAQAAEATMLQAVLHNTTTNCTDMEMLISVFRARNDLVLADNLSALLVNSYVPIRSRLAVLFEGSARKVWESGQTHEISPEAHGHERTIPQIEAHAAKLARPDYAR